MYYYLIDTETNGISATEHELTEISILRCSDLVQKTWNVKIKYPERCQPMALEITKKTREELISRGKYIEDVIPLVNSFFNEDGAKPEERVALAHNALFDQRFCEHHWLDNKDIFPVKMWCCTLAMSRKYNRLNGLSKDAKLKDMIIKTGIKHNLNHLHNSTQDVQATYKLHKFLTSHGIDELEFIKASKSYIAHITSGGGQDSGDNDLSDIYG